MIASINQARRLSWLRITTCQAVGATAYLSGPFGRNYLDQERFPNAGVKVMLHDYRPTLYAQLWGDFISHLSAIDAILSLGPMARETMIAGHICRSDRQ